MSPDVMVLDAPTWRAQAAGFLDYSYRQVWEYGVACAVRLRARSEHVAVVAGGEICGLADVRIRRVPLLGGGIAYINGGPLVRRGQGDDAVRLRLCLAALRSEYVARRRLVLRVAPPLGPPGWHTRLADECAAQGFTGCTAPRYRTVVLDLTLPPAVLRRQLAQKWRNGLNRAERNGLTVRVAEDDAVVAAFVELYASLRERKQFAVDLDAEFYARVQRELTADERFTLTVAEHGGRVVAGHLGSCLGDTCVYLLGAADRVGLEQKASYLLQWHVICAAQARHAVRYDLGGVDPDRNPGVYHFKSGLGGTEVVVPGPFECAPGAMGRMIVRGAERVHRWLHRRARARAMGATVPAPAQPEHA